MFGAALASRPDAAAHSAGSGSRRSRTGDAARRPAPAVSAGRSRGSTMDRPETTTSISRRQPWRSASSSIRPSRGSTGSAASRCPTAVSRGASRVVGLGERPELGQQPQPVGHLGAVGRLDEREVGDRPEPGRGHLQDHRGQVGPQDLRLGELRPAEQVLLAVQPDAHARGDPAAAPGPLVGGGLRDRLDRQPLHLGPRRVARDPGRARVDDVPDARHGQRGLGHVGGQHDPAAGVRRRRPGAARPTTAGRTAAAPRCAAAGRRAGPRRGRGSPARRTGTPGCRRRRRCAARRRRPARAATWSTSPATTGGGR